MGGDGAFQLLAEVVDVVLVAVYEAGCFDGFCQDAGGGIRVDPQGVAHTRLHQFLRYHFLRAFALESLDDEVGRCLGGVWRRSFAGFLLQGFH